MTGIDWQVAAQLGTAWVVGGVVGFERSYHGRAAGFRTHALVCLAAAAAMTVAAAPSFTPGLYAGQALRLDPTRLAQGVLTGVGFLGAGVIFKEGVNVQGLTTSASIWATAVIGILFGLGEYLAGGLTAAGVMTTLIVLRWVEDAAPVEVYAWSVFRFRTADAPAYGALEQMLRDFGVEFHDVSYGRTEGGQLVQFSGPLTARRSRAFDELAAHLHSLKGLVEFQLDRVSK